MDRELLLKQLQDTLQKIRETKDLVFIENVRRNILKEVIFAGIVSNTVTDITETVNTGVPGTVVVADRPDAKVIVTIDGTNYYLPLYNI